MRVHVLQHVPFEGIGCMASWFESRDAKVTYTRFYEVDDLPVVAGLDLIIVMGGALCGGRAGATTTAPSPILPRQPDRQPWRRLADEPAH